MTDVKHGGLWSAMVFSGMIRVERWHRAVEIGEVIGQCRVCGGYLIPDDIGADDGAPVDWFTASCLDCGHEVASPGGRTLKHRERGRSGW